MNFVFHDSIVVQLQVIALCASFCKQANPNKLGEILP